MTQFVHHAHRFDNFGNEVQIFHANKGQGLPRHEHDFDHVTFCMAGSCVIRKEGRQVVVDKFTQPINLVAHEWHEIEALEDGTVFCNVFGEQM